MAKTRPKPTLKQQRVDRENEEEFRQEVLDQLSDLQRRQP
jgi:hypothetical protein